MPTKQTTRSSAAEPAITSLADWKAGARMRPTLSSGRTVQIRALTLDELAAADGLPDDLLRVALLEQVPGGVVAEIARQLEEGDPGSLAAAKKLSEDNLKLRDRIVLEAVIAPALKPKDLAELDPFDKAEIAEFAQRRRTIDATGRPLGSDLNSYLRAWRETHGCGFDCPHCHAVSNGALLTHA
jgi:hypothetical protein